MTGPRCFERSVAAVDVAAQAAASKENHIEGVGRFESADVGTTGAAQLKASQCWHRNRGLECGILDVELAAAFLQADE